VEEGQIRPELRFGVAEWLVLPQSIGYSSSRTTLVRHGLPAKSSSARVTGK
jgi:hypothetical protein